MIEALPRGNEVVGELQGTLGVKALAILAEARVGSCWTAARARGVRQQVAERARAAEKAAMGAGAPVEAAAMQRSNPVSAGGARELEVLEAALRHQLVEGFRYFRGEADAEFDFKPFQWVVKQIEARPQGQAIFDQLREDFSEPELEFLNAVRAGGLTARRARTARKAARRAMGADERACHSAMWG